MPFFKNQKGFAPLILIVLIAVIGGSGFLAVKNLGINQPQPTADKGFVRTQSATTSAITRFQKKSLPRQTALPKTVNSPSPSSTAASAASSTNSSSSTSSNNNTSTNSTPTSTPKPTTLATPLPTPTPTSTSQSSCATICFDQNNVNVTVQEGSNIESGGSTAAAFNIYGKGAQGFMLTKTGLPAGISINPSSGGFADGSSVPVKVWINTNNSTAYGTYSGTVTLKTGTSTGSYVDTGNSLNITVTYIKKN